MNKTNKMWNMASVSDDEGEIVLYGDIERPCEVDQVQLGFHRRVSDGNACSVILLVLRTSDELGILPSDTEGKRTLPEECIEGIVHDPRFPDQHLPDLGDESVDQAEVVQHCTGRFVLERYDRFVRTDSRCDLLSCKLVKSRHFIPP